MALSPDRAAHIPVKPPGNKPLDRFTNDIRTSRSLFGSPTTLQSYRVSTDVVLAQSSRDCACVREIVVLKIKINL